jgi:hypothetical protein
LCYVENERASEDVKKGTTQQNNNKKSRKNKTTTKTTITKQSQTLCEAMREKGRKY